MTTQLRRVYGPAGCGKTTFLAEQAQRAADQFGSDKVVISSFTRAAAIEIASRNTGVDRSNVGTLHSLCYRAAGNPELAEAHVAEWNEVCGPNEQLNPGNLDDPFAGQMAGDDAFRLCQLLRNKRTRPEAWPAHVTAFNHRWADWKRAQGYQDFTDLIEFGIAELPYAPGMPKALFVDEAQDLNPLQLELIDQWSKNTEWTIMVGDPDQCQPPGETVLTTEGYKAIETLTSADRVVCLDRKSGVVSGFNSGHKITICERNFTGRILELVTEDGKTARATDCHFWLARFTPEARKLHCVYLMRKGNRWRVGWCNLFSGWRKQEEYTFHLGIRSHLEKADEAWILRITNSHEESSIWENYFAAHYGIPTIPFEPVDNAKTLTRTTIDQTFNLLGDALRNRAHHLLDDAKKRIDRPFWESQSTKNPKGRHGWMKIAACNLIPEIMEVPTHIGGKFHKTERFSLKSHWYVGPVFSLDVEKHHNYITSGIVTHNCIYSFAGSDPYAFVNAPAEQKFHPASLKRSWRLPRAVHSWSLNWIRQITERDDIVFAPRDAEGEVVQLGSHIDWRYPETIVRAIAPYTAQGKKVGVLATCGYMLDPLKKELRSEGLPFHNPWRLNRGDWNPLGKVSDRVGVFLRPCREVWAGQADCWTGPMLNRWADGVRSEGVFKRGAKTQIKALKDVARPLYTELLDLFLPGIFEEIMRRCDTSAVAACDWLLEHAINDQMRARLSYPIRCIEKTGPRALFDEPRIVIGTGHSVKGADKLDVVVLLPDLSSEADRAWRTSGHLRDSIVRLVYVMATRARESLLLARSSGDLAVWN